MKYLVCQEQHGEGCDYTIGCGMRYDFIEAGSIDDVIEQIIYTDGRDEECALEGEYALAEILIVPAHDVFTVDMDAIAAAARDEKDRRKADAKRRREMKELKRLRKKYEA
jgi:hypothetical protein